MLEYIVLGILQGIAEWLPVSSEGMIVLVKHNFFPSDGGIEETIRLALFMHLGTFLAAFVYFFKDVKQLILGIFNFKSQDQATQNTLVFLLVATFISGLLGFTFIKLLENFTGNFENTGRIITFCVGVFLIGTAFLELRAKTGGYRTTKDLTTKDNIILGITQGFAAMPGLSRSGLTVSMLLLLKMDKAQALRLSFLLSLPIVLAGNIILNLGEFAFSAEAAVGLFCSFVFGLLTIHGLLKVAEKINFGYFVLAIAILTIASVFI